MSKLNVAILLFDEIEVLDFAGPFEVYSVTSELNQYKLFNVYMVAEEKRPIIAVNGLSVNPDYAIADAPAPDILIVPGGAGSRAAMKSSAILSWIKQHHPNTKHTVSVCTGALVLGKAGLLDNLEITTHHELYDFMQKVVPSATLNRTTRFVDNGHIMTSGGISAGIDMSLHIVEKLHGPDISNKTRIYMEYGNWRELE
ncbi:MAG: DJ-1/PfpI family protein [Chloroflexota bacterium]